jgi:hypothetical protein
MGGWDMNKERDLLTKCLEALRIGYESANAEAGRFHTSMAGYKEKEHQQYDEDVAQIKAAIDEIDAEPAKPEAEPIGFVRMYELEHLQKQIRKEDQPIYAAQIWGMRLEDDNVPLYTSPRPMQRLTDEELTIIGLEFLHEKDDLSSLEQKIMDALIEKNK